MLSVAPNAASRGSINIVPRTVIARAVITVAERAVPAAFAAASSFFSPRRREMIDAVWC